MQTAIFLTGLVIAEAGLASFSFISWKRAGTDFLAVGACYVAIQCLWRFI